ncbi:LacI family transcriptional regulator [Catenulispora sp. MAP12-49]|uniref:LacI family DNA-binding transcriptional regulator n=1 Tax=unclassified Catenulispora TaxID=414885 RepID=UPI003510E613
MTARLVDVAQLAGVSRATASRVIAGTPRNVAPELVERVERAARELGYRTNPSARALRTGTTGTFGVVVPSLANPYFVQLIEALSRRVRAGGGVLVVSDAANAPDIEAREIDTLANGKVDGLIVVPVTTAASGAAIRAAASVRPVVQFDRWADGAGTVALTLDNHAAISMLIDHLRGLGREKIALVAAEQSSSSGAERSAAFADRCGADGRTIVLPSITTDAGRKAGRRVLRMRGDVDAVVCAADVLAIGLVSTLNRAGVAVPAEVAVTAFDDTAILEVLDPPLTSIRHPLDEMADRAIALLHADQAEREERVERFAPELVVRASSGTVQEH